MSKVVAIAQARMGSTRAPGKVMRDLEGWPVFEWVVRALKMVPGIDEIVVATSTLPADDIIVEHCKSIDVKWFRGSETDVLDRYYQCAQEYEADVILRITCDCPFLDPAVVGEVVKLREVTNADYASNVSPPSYPDGLDVEVFTRAALSAAWAEAKRQVDRDTVTQFISRNRKRFKVVNARCPIPGLASERWVLDSEDDWEFCKALASKMVWHSEAHPKLYNTTTYLSILDILKKHPELRSLNESGVRNERFYEQLSREELGPRQYTISDSILKSARKIIPLGSQTFSKSYVQFPAGRHPLYVTHGDGARVFDVDGNDYVDLVGAILPVVLGYRDREVDEAIRHQLDQGIIFSLSTELEYQLAERMVSLIPCAEMVRFGKSGTDVTTAAVRLARAYTGRNKVLVGGYHGWADWSMAVTNRDLGIPLIVKHNSIKFEGLHQLDKSIAAIIVEPNDDPEFLSTLRETCTELGIVLIFDEIITGFRYHVGGAQKLFGVTPDIACFGKAMGNGMPISAVCGKRKIMKLMEPPNNIFYSGTMFGETLSLAASIATIDKIVKHDVPRHLFITSMTLDSIAYGAILRWGLEDYISLSGRHPRRILNFNSDQIRTLFLICMAEEGVLIINSHNLSYAIGKPEIDRISKAYDHSCSIIRWAIDNKGFKDVLAGVKLVSAAPLRMKK